VSDVDELDTLLQDIVQRHGDGTIANDQVTTELHNAIRDRGWKWVSLGASFIDCPITVWAIVVANRKRIEATWPSS
jgi:hypothetical protein